MRNRWSKTLAITWLAAFGIPVIVGEVVGIGNFSHIVSDLGRAMDFYEQADHRLERRDGRVLQRGYRRAGRYFGRLRSHTEPASNCGNQRSRFSAEFDDNSGNPVDLVGGVPLAIVCDPNNLYLELLPQR
jgi:hypothetical protein